MIGKIEPAETWQLIAYLPGRNFNTPQDEHIMFTTHTDGPSISQDDGGFGLLGVAEYFSKIPEKQRPRTLMFFFDNRHYMPGAERAFAKENWLEQHPELWNKVVATIGMEHLGQLEFTEQGETFKPTGLVEHSRLHATNNDKLIELAIKAVKDNGLRRVTVEQVDRPGIHGAARARGSVSARSDARVACRRLRRWATWACTGARARDSIASTPGTLSIRSRRWRS